MISLVTETPFERWRAETLFTKEPGTVAWIQAQAKPGDVFYDIGANIGGYALMAAQRVVPDGCVVAFEPHIVTAASLLRNIHKNAAKVQVITSALHSVDAFVPFQYYKSMSGSSGSQLGEPIAETGETFVPEAVEIKHATTIDRLVNERVIPPPTLIKLDVDGHELGVLKGMLQQLREPALRSIQVEWHPETGALIASFMARHGFAEVSRHFTALGQEQIAQGADESKVFCNVIFERSA